VALEEYLPCLACAWCLSGDFRLCEATEIKPGGLRYGSTGLDVAPGLWGAYARYQYLHPSTVFHRMPAHVPARLATLALPLGNGIEWVHRQGGAGPGQCVLVQGPGPQGLACVVAAKEAGASCVIVTGRGTPQDLARWEKANGRVPKNAWVLLRTGWSKRKTAKEFLNVGEDGPHAPGFHQDTSRILAHDRDQVRPRQINLLKQGVHQHTTSISL
jgi:hypothetical protein